MRNIQTNGFPISTHHFLDDFGGPLFQEPPFDLYTLVVRVPSNVPSTCHRFCGDC